MKTFQYRGDEVVLKCFKYGHGNGTAVELHDANTGEPVSRVTANVPSVPLGKREVIIRTTDYKDMLDFLVTNKIVEPTDRHVRSGYATFPIARLLIDPRKYE